LASKNELAFLSIAEAARLIRRKKISPLELTDLMLARIEALNPKINAYITVCGDLARKAARAAEREIMRGHYRGPLHGIPISIKDNIYTSGIRTTAGSKILRNFVPDEDAEVVSRLKEAGAIILGKTNMHEFAYGVTCENPHYGSVRNPWDLTRIAGGSSGGSAAALAAGMCYGSVGTDTGGSIRIPAALCGVVGCKPTADTVALDEVVELSSSLDHAGPLARTATDIAILLRALMVEPLANRLENCLTTKPAVALRPFRQLNELRLGLPATFFFEQIDPEVEALVRAAVNWFERAGAQIENIEIPEITASEKAGNDIALPEAAAFHSVMNWFPARADDYGEDVRKRLELGRETRALDYLAALEFQQRFELMFTFILGQVDAVLTPVTPIAAPRIGEKEVILGGQQESVRAALLRLCRPANLMGAPATSVPCGFTAGGQPVGLQIIGRPMDEATVLRLAHTYEQAHAWHTMHPPIADLPE
jgi:aspartyl-tRNA(Asn)/glutamyl-tRNA(Gln) amidotransferase subunit A